MGIPVIDVKNIDAGDRKAIMAQIAKACESPGFFQVFMLVSYQTINHSLQNYAIGKLKLTKVV